MTYIIYQLFRFISSLEYSAKKRLTPNGLIVLISLIFSGIFGLDTNESMTYQIFTFLLSTLTISIIYSRFFRFHYNAVRILPRFATVGITLKYRIIVQNKTNQTQNSLKLWENFADPRPNFKEFIETPAPSEEQRNFLDKHLGYYRWLRLTSRKQCATAKAINLPSLAPHSKTEIVLEIKPTHRGVIRLTGLTVARSDPFGLWNAYKTISLPQSLLILPKLYHVPPIQLPGSRRYQSGGIALASSVGDSEEFRSLREYRPGDPLRKIHWKSWAKVGKPIVKEEQDEFFVRHALILDTFQTQKYSEILEEAISIAASLAGEFQTQESLLDLMFVAQEAYCFTFGRGLNSTDKMLEILASLGACRDKDFEFIIPVVIEKVSLLSGCICIFLCWDEPRKRLVNYLKSRGISTLVLILTNKESQLKELDSRLINDELTSFHLLKLGKIQEELMKL
ncbi:DUF58 domain-containing protein [Ancylothrix sp. C2]|uniref:DUF58 domain-containing protein n=1 Tax=Ancylothrix sp. D3o TaxID=2953691 RepID=UPI0021BA5B84|nr:DUF58 domain-containing protein [Ancylothrix sp. D3o]MCT7952167.1 DUF58 domain-containing protein [Ancylothrix sp. D3o]